MSALATSDHQDAKQAPEHTKRLRLSKPIREAINLIATGAVKTQRAAAERVGLSEVHLSRMLNRSDIRVFLAQEMRRTIATAGIRASHRIAELIDASSEHVSLDAAKHVLGIEGIKPAADAQVSVAIDVKAGFVIDLREPGERAKVIDGHTVSTDSVSPDKAGDDA